MARRLSHHLKGGEAIELVSDLGGGKTTFVQGLAHGLGYSGEVSSPTFTLSHSYRINPNLELHHYDLYRLGQGGIVGEELAEDLRDPQVITVIEWAGIVEHELPQDRLKIAFTVTGDTDRKLTFSSGGPISDQIIQGIKHDSRT